MSKIANLIQIIRDHGEPSGKEINDAAAELAALRARLAELEAYVRKAERWFDDFGEHSPIVFGGEEEMSNEAAALLERK